jgi:hypothetical protein
MKKLIGLFAFAMALTAGMVTLSYAAGDTADPGSKTVNGDLLKIEGEFYTVHDKSGHEVRLHIDKSTKLEGDAFKTGDKVEVEATDKDHALSIKHVQPKMQDVGSETRK